MERENRPNLKISGTGKSGGGTYNEVKINGAGSINGNLDCIDFICNGLCSVSGNIKTKTAKLDGKTTIDGSLESKKARINGQVKIRDNADIKNLFINGSTDIDGSLISEEIVVKGGLNIKGDCNAEYFSAKGGFNIIGLLNAGHIDIDLYFKSQVKEIGGEMITVNRGKTSGFTSFIKTLFPNSRFNDELIVETIEGDDIFLENTRAKVVRGNNISIGKGCVVELAEYKNNFRQHMDAKVAGSKKI
jgi:cytoskeletal protein CcmA (bactofilin family)